MKKLLICFSIIYLFTTLTGCGSYSGLTHNTESSNERVDMENISADKDDTEYNYIATTPEITKLEHGFSAVRYDGDYSFDQFLEQGGAESDQDVLHFLTDFYLAEGDKNGIGTQQSHTRFEILTKTLEENSDMTVPEVRDTLDSVSKDNFNEYESMEWSIVFDQSALTATYYHREDYETDYSFKL